MLQQRLQRETLAVVLGGGEGSRLFPLTRDRSKPAVPLGGKYRFIDIALSNCINSGLRHIFVLTQYNSASLNNHVAWTYKFDSFSPGFVAILATEQRHNNMQNLWSQGTADALRHSLKYIQDPSFRNILVIPGDHLCRMNFNSILEMHERENADVTLCATTTGRKEIKNFRCLKIAEDGRIIDFVRKPSEDSVLSRFQLSSSEKAIHGINPLYTPDESYLAFIGVYLFKREALVHLLEKNNDKDLGRDTLPHIVMDTKSYAYVFNGYWRDIGTISSFYDASIALTSKNPPFKFHDKESPIFTHGRFLPSACVYNSNLNGVIISEGANIENATVEHSVIGVRANIREGSNISHSIIFGADTYEGENRRASAIKGEGLPPLGIGNNCVIKRAIIDKNVRIGEGCRLENKNSLSNSEGENYYIRDGVIIIPKGSVIPPGTII